MGTGGQKEVAPDTEKGIKFMRNNLGILSIILVGIMFVMSSLHNKAFGQSRQLNGHEYIDLGLPSGTKWATCNIGARLSSDYGEHFASSFVDIATQKWGNGWSTPTYNDFYELMNKCSWRWTNQNGKNGYIVKESNGNSIFLPAAGYRTGSNRVHSHAGSYGHYWSSSHYTTNRCNTVYDLVFSSEGRDVNFSYHVTQEQSIRPVCHK